jgi:hypothetical protein
MDPIVLLRRQFLQLLDPEILAIPPRDVLRVPVVQHELFNTMFRQGFLEFPPTDRYQLRVLKKLVSELEQAIVDPEEDVGFPTSCFGVDIEPFFCLVSASFLCTVESDTMIIPGDCR